VDRQDSGRDPARTAAGRTATLASDDDREAAALVLSEAFAEGRLTADEHGERVRAVYAARTWHELGRLTADLPDPDGAAGRPVAGRTDGLDRCLPAGIAWLLAARHRARASRHRVLAAVGPAAYGPAGNAVRARDGWRAEDR